MLSTKRFQSDSCPEFHLLIICLLAEHMVHFHAIRGTTNSWKSLTKNNVHKIRSSFLYSFVSNKKPDPCPIKINDYFGSCHLKNLADSAIKMWQEFQFYQLPSYMSLQKNYWIHKKHIIINRLWSDYKIHYFGYWKFKLHVAGMNNYPCGFKVQRVKLMCN